MDPKQITTSFFITKSRRHTNHFLLRGPSYMSSRNASATILTEPIYAQYVWMDCIQRPKSNVLDHQFACPAATKPFGRACVLRCLAHDIDLCPNCKRECITKYRPGWCVNCLLALFMEILLWVHVSLDSIRLRKTPLPGVGVWSEITGI